VSFGPTVGSEIRKTRPAVVMSNNAANLALNRVVVVPLTSNTSKVYPGEALVRIGEDPAKAMADQIITADKQRLRNRKGVLSAADIRAVEDAILLHLGIRR
jgi:mRNA interferase MazF